MFPFLLLFNIIKVEARKLICSLSLSLTRTNMHARTDYFSVKLIKDMVQHGKEAYILVDKNGWLPAHIACSVIVH
jgi:hypothetical protein